MEAGGSGGPATGALGDRTEAELLDPRSEPKAELPDGWRWQWSAFGAVKRGRPVGKWYVFNHGDGHTSVQLPSQIPHGIGVV